MTKRPFTKEDLLKALGRCVHYEEDYSSVAHERFAAYASKEFPRALAVLEEAWDFLVECRVVLLYHKEREDLRDLWWRLALYTDGLESAEEE